MRGGGKVNYTSGSLARAKARSKTSQSPNRPSKRSSSALFPQKIFIPSPLRRRAAAGNAARSQNEVEIVMELDEPSQARSSSSPMKVKKEVMSKNDWMRDSELAMARRAGGVSQRDTEEQEGGWWVSFGKASQAGQRFRTEMDEILSRKTSSPQSAQKRGKRIRGDIRSSIGGKYSDGLFDRPDCLDTPHWLRLLPRKDRPVVETDEMSEV